MTQRVRVSVRFLEGPRVHDGDGEDFLTENPVPDSLMASYPCPVRQFSAAVPLITA